ncbi:hypothetical protein HCN44_010483 [Aphidius gifuensis]|uniref:Uncharacterized protein n=1 Tax=Aphidius gifuensis TaxID=684658 RepID=A0A835CPX2_APHGI|nr:zinc homeostasis factor 1 [Aphidius gifuensis]KAF7991682.1 hypothetical protein HCN44_010483 [Aphidius gifuensis]
MTVKEWVRQLQPVQLYIVLFFTVAFLAIEITVSGTTHSNTLLLNAYHMICNVIALGGCILSIKYGNQEQLQSRKEFMDELEDFSVEDSVEVTNKSDKVSSVSSTSNSKTNSSRRMKNTFGWARINILTMVVSCIFLASFCFTTFVEAVQTLFHISHLDAMHQPLLVMALGICGIVLNVFCYIIIGGFTFTQGFFIHVNKDGKVVLDKNSTSSRKDDGIVQLTDSTKTSPMTVPRQKFKEMCRDVIGCIFVVIASIIVYLTEPHIAKFVDPIIAIISSIILFAMSCPYLTQSCMILLQIIPHHIKIDLIKEELINSFSGIVNVHEFHIWQLAGNRIITTVHIIFLDEMAYRNTIQHIPNFFNEIGLTNVTVQPEFYHNNSGDDSCLMQCPKEECLKLQCCPIEEEALKAIACVANEVDEASSNANYESKTVAQTPNSSKDIQSVNNDVDKKTAGCKNNCQNNSSNNSEDELTVGDETPCSTMAF